MERREYFGTSGIRGRVGETVTADLALAVGRALAADADTVVVGRDPRASGGFLADALAAGVAECGGDVVDIGPAATPTVARSVAWQDADAGVSVTASHNPPEYNGLKLWQPSGQAFDTPKQDAVVERLVAEEFPLAGWDDAGRRREWGEARRRHRDAITDAVDVDPADAPSVVVDVGNGAGGVSVDALTELGCDVETLNAQPDGRFPGRPSEPTAENCASLCDLVASSDADLGIAHDGDADRMMAVTGDGDFVSGDALLAIFAASIADAGDRVAAPVDTSLMVADALDDVGADLVRTRVGDVYVAERAADPDVVFGGEPSGAWIFPGETRCPDGPLAAAKLAALVADEPLAERVAALDPYPIRRGSYEVPDKTATMERIRERVLDGGDDVDTLDGVRVDLGDAWYLVRASGTEPIVRVTAEARDEARADDVFADAEALVADAADAADIAD
ncbi:phosphoglucosamine mutase [Halocalculus aciditolerans]|uniref:Phosphoglucosamine mutase n=1 Tax=Halocalculus aciditolerans TaxID=1383812 RepID=A0A830FIE8_9EURY|nr:phosphoglucosamine mutase [Halocalculus aciditolerans]GGL55762.1 phosphoglucosamine mutase [Halocalculus aciditolerans]